MYGYITPTVKKTDYMLGTLPTSYVNPLRTWMTHLPAEEVQRKNGLETSNCSNYGTLNALEGLWYVQYGELVNFSERYTGVMTRTKPEGNDPSKVIEIIRNYSGLIPETELPFDDAVTTWDQYYSGVSFSTKLDGISFLKKWKIGYEWVLPGNNNNWKERLKVGLRYSPLGVAVQAWSKGPDGLYVRRGQDCHWVAMVGFVDGKYWVVFDSYDKCLKKLDWEYDFTFAMRYSITPRTTLDMSFYQRATRGVLGLY